MPKGGPLVQKKVTLNTKIRKKNGPAICQLLPLNGLARLTPARPDRNGNGPVPAYFFSVLQSGFLAHACSMPACLHQNFKGNLKEHLFGLKKDWKQGKSRSKCGSPKKFLQVSFQLLA